MNLFFLDASINQNAEVHDDNSNDLDGVLAAESIPHQHALVYEAKNEQGEICGNCARIAAFVARSEVLSGPHQPILEFGEDVAADG